MNSDEFNIQIKLKEELNQKIKNLSKEYNVPEDTIIELILENFLDNYKK